MIPPGKYRHRYLTTPFRLFVCLIFMLLTTSFGLPVIYPTELITESDTESDITPPQTEIMSGEDYLAIPFKYAGRLFMVEAVIDGQEGNLIFDTGASGIVVNRTYFRKYLQSAGGKSNGITGTVNDVSSVKMGEIKMSGLVAKNVSATVADLSHIENKKGVKVLGLFGFKMIRDFEIVIDINRQVLYLYSIGKNGERASSDGPVFNADFTQPFETSKNVVFIRGSIAGRDMKFCLDTGAEINAVSSRCNKNVLRTIEITGNSSLNGVGTSQARVISGIMSDFRYGDRDLKGMTSIITDLDPLCDAYDTSLEGMLGYDFLKKGIFCINFVTHQIGIIYSTRQ